MDENKTFQVRQYRDGYGTGTQVATGLSLVEAATVLATLTMHQDEYGGNREFTVLAD